MNRGGTKSCHLEIAMPAYWPEVATQLVRWGVIMVGFVVPAMFVTVVAGNHGGANPGRDV